MASRLSAVYSWLDDRLEQLAVKGGAAVFSAAAISAGERLAVFGGHMMKLSDEPPGDYALQIDTDLVVGAADITELEQTDFFNHSCNPNAGLQGQIMLLAMRDIAAGDQVCFDYATVLDAPGYRFDCQCGSPECRGVVTGEDWKLRELQRRYRGWFSWHLERKIARVRSGRVGSSRGPGHR